MYHNHIDYAPCSHQCSGSVLAVKTYPGPLFNCLFSYMIRNCLTPKDSGWHTLKSRNRKNEDFNKEHNLLVHLFPYVKYLNSLIFFIPYIFFTVLGCVYFQRIFFLKANNLK